MPETALVFSADSAIYATWLPTAGKNDSDPGSPITVTATLRNTAGSPLTRKATAFMFELVDVSREPGYIVRVRGEAFSTVRVVALAR